MQDSQTTRTNTSETGESLLFAKTDKVKKGLKYIGLAFALLNDTVAIRLADFRENYLRPIMQRGNMKHKYKRRCTKYYSDR